MTDINEIFGSLVFDDRKMREKLSDDVYKKLRKTIEQGKDLDLDIANSVAQAMKEWALENNATHYTHWFQPMTGITAEKHESFINPTEKGGMILSFSGKELIKGEPDASSFPSGGLRATFEARGYTAWDPTSYAFLKGHTLCIPTVFCSYGGEVLDWKTPLLRSMQALNTSAGKILSLFGQKKVNVVTTVGIEQEYFLIDKNLFEEREDLKFTGRTLLGAAPVKGQELDDHYFGSLRPRVKSYMKELDRELWKLGIYSKTRHNEVAPSQHELAPVFTTANTAVDHNQLIMEVMKKVAIQHGLACLLHEKPFEGINGSGKHNNWSISTDRGENLLEPGDSPGQNARFLLFLVAVIASVDKYQDLLRASVASAGNDCRLGANEAPPAIVSMFIGDDLKEILDNIVESKQNGVRKKEPLILGVNVLPKFSKDTTDRNRTSPFAFTGNKFEFRMLGSAASVSFANVVLNTILSETLDCMAEKLNSAEDFHLELTNLVREMYLKHRRIVFNGNNYSDSWLKEAADRGLENLRSTVDAIPVFLKDKNLHLFEKYDIFSKSEMISRYDILLENYIKTVNIEASTLLVMVKRKVLPAVRLYCGNLADQVAKLKTVSSSLKCDSTINLINFLSETIDNLSTKVSDLEKSLENCKKQKDLSSIAISYHSDILSLMEEIRKIVDKAEEIIPAKDWPMPVYNDLLYSV